MGKISFAVGEISGLVMLGEGYMVGFADVVGLESGGWVLARKFFESGVV